MRRLRTTRGDRQERATTVARTDPPAADTPLPGAILSGNRAVAGLLSGGQPLAASTRRQMEGRFGRDLSEVRLHSGALAEQLTSWTGAAAATTGNHVFLPDGATGAGAERLLVHELTHVVQHQQFGAGGRAVSRAGDAAEREAKRAEQLPSSAPVPVTAVPAAALARSPLDWVEDLAGEAWDTASEVAGEAKDTVAQGASAVWDSASEIAAGAGEVIADGASEGWDAARAGASFVYEGMKFNAGLIKQGEELVGEGIDWVEAKEKQATHWLVEQAEGVPGLEQVVGAAADLVDLQTELTGGALRGVTGLVGGVLTIIADPVDTAKGLEAMAEHLPMIPGLPNPLKVLHGLVDVATGGKSWEDFGRELDPVASLKGDAKFWGAVGKGIVAQYSKQWGEKKYADVIGHVGFDIAALFLGAGEAGAAGKTGEAGRIADAADVARAADAAEAAKAAGAAEVAMAADAAEVVKGEEIWAELGRELETTPVVPRPQNAGQGFLEAESAGFVGPQGAPGTVDLGMQPHSAAPAVRDAMSVTGTTHQSAHVGPTSFLRDLPQYSRGGAETTILPRGTHAALDSTWKNWAMAQRRLGATDVTVSELRMAMNQAIDATPGLTAGQKGALSLSLDVELFETLGLSPEQRVELPYPNIAPAP